MTETESDQRQYAGDNMEFDVGSALREARRRRQLELAEVAAQLKLPRTTIEHLENGRLERVASIYRRGYIANYARLVGLDPQPLLDALDADEPAPLREVMPAPRSGQGFDRFVRFASYLLATTVIVPPLVYFFVIGGARLFEAEPVAVGEAAPGAAETGEERPAGYRERIADALALRPLDDGREQDSHLSASALPLGAMRAPVAVDPAAAEPVAANEPAPPEETVGPMARIGLELVEDSWVEIETADGERIEFDLLRAGTARSYSGMPPFRVLLGRANAVNMTLDGRPYDFDGHDQGGVVEIEVGAVPMPAGGEGETPGGSATE
ncbi:MAG: DUF4115 domain-containing protein [Wenzhouxiangellaceae bacterium]|nr:DUF4115 domain-containing protein [Wenzhouxiangellaceae bacterium]